MPGVRLGYNSAMASAQHTRETQPKQLLSSAEFLRTMPAALVSRLPAHLQGIHSRQPFRWLVQFHFGEPRLHYEVSPAWQRAGWELGLHFEAEDKNLNRYLLIGFRRHLAEVKDRLGESMEAEMWTHGWTKVYDVLPQGQLTIEYQGRAADRLSEIIVCLQPIFAELRDDVKRIYR